MNLNKKHAYALKASDSGSDPGIACAFEVCQIACATLWRSIDSCESVRGRAFGPRSTCLATSTYTIVLSRISRFVRSEKRSEDDSDENRFRMIQPGQIDETRGKSRS